MKDILFLTGSDNAAAYELKEKYFFKMKSKKVRICGVGEVLLERSNRAKHMGLSVRPFKGARLAVPRGVTFVKAEEFAHSKSDWLKKHLNKMASMEKQAAELQRRSPINRAEARKRLVERLDELSEKYGFCYNKVFVRNQKTRWGSCSEKNNINLNVNLIRLPNVLMDYVMVHELVHTRIKNHGNRFWNELDKYVKNARNMDRNLENYQFLLL